MRALAAGMLVLLFALLGAQEPGQATPADSTGSVRPQIVAYIRQHISGASLIELSMVEPGYPADLLQKQINDLCAKLDYPARGLQLYEEELVANNPNLRFRKATFATGNLTLPDGTVKLTPILQSFAGAPAPYTIKGLTIIFDGLKPTEKTLKSFRSTAAVVDGRLDLDPPTVEYHVQLLTQNPSEINVQSTPAPVEHTVSQAPVQRPNTGLIWGLIILAGLAAGALVYFVLIKRPFGGPSNPPRSR